MDIIKDAIKLFSQARKLREVYCKNCGQPFMSRGECFCQDCENALVFDYDEFEKRKKLSNK